MRDDIQANDEIYEEVVGKDAPGCLRGSGSTSKGNKLDFISREEFERAVQEKATQEVTSIQKKLEDDILKYKNAWNTEMEALKNRLITLETKDTHVSIYLLLFCLVLSILENYNFCFIMLCFNDNFSYYGHIFYERCPGHRILNAYRPL